MNVHYLDNHPVALSNAKTDKVVAEAKALLPSVFRGVEWSGYRWDVTDSLSKHVNPGQRRQNQYLVFTQHSGAGRKVSAALDDEVPFPQRWADLVKAYTVIRAHNRDVSKETHMWHIAAWRWLYSVSADVGHDPGRLTNHHFLQAAHAFARHTDASGSRYNLGKCLCTISDFADSRKLFQVRIHFQKNPFPRPTNAGGSKHRKVSRGTPSAPNTKLPSEEVILALATLANREDLSAVDEMVVRGCEILLSVGFRISEMLELPTDCFDGIEVIDDQTGKPVTRYRIGYRARKAGTWAGRWVPTASVPLVERAVRRLQELTAEARRHRLFLETSGFRRLLVFADFAPDEEIHTSKVQEVLEIEGNTGHVCRYLESRGIAPCRKDPRRGAAAKGVGGSWWRVGDIERGLIAADADKRPLVDRDGVRIPLSDSLFLLPANATHKEKATSMCDFSILQQQQIQDILVGRKTMKDEFPSIFDRYGLKGSNGESLSLNTHQPRHWLTTLAAEGRVLTQVEIASFFGRKHIKDNEAYDHSGEPIPGEVIAKKMMQDHDLTREAVEKFVRTFPLLDWEAAVQMTKEDIGAVHVTDVGLCFSDFAQSPCHRHLQCLRGCERYQRQKGNHKELDAISKIKARTEVALASARKALGNKYYGASEWVKSHEIVVRGCIEALAVEERDVEAGAIVTVFVGKETLQ